MGGEWRNATLGNLVALQRGHDLTDAERRPGTVPVMGSAGQNGTHDTAKSRGPGLVIGRSGASFGKVHYCEGDYWPHNTALYVTDFKGNHPRFAYYLLKAIDFSRYNSGSAQPSLNRNYIHAIPVAFPSLPDQRAIACILGALDDKIELNRQRNRTLESMARAIFQSWFVDFDPVKAKVAGRTPPGLNREIAALFPDTFDDSELGLIPATWRACNWGDIATLEYGKSLRGYADASGLVRVFGTNGPIGWHTESLSEGPGIVIGRKGAYRGVHYTSQPFYVIDTAYYLRPKQPIDFKWAYYQLIKCDINGMDSGSAIPSTSRADFYALTVCVPPSPVLETFGKTIQPLYDRRDAANIENDTLSELRDALLPKLISGELRVPDAERIVGRTA